MLNGYTTTSKQQQKHFTPISNHTKLVWNKFLISSFNFDNLEILPCQCQGKNCTIKCQFQGCNIVLVCPEITWKIDILVQVPSYAYSLALQIQLTSIYIFSLSNLSSIFLFLHSHNKNILQGRNWLFYWLFDKVHRTAKVPPHKRALKKVLVIKLFWSLSSLVCALAANVLLLFRTHENI